jgi:DMSO/TMAO reductase YedYZ molybdopterin-dependent catalytic subunit
MAREFSVADLSPEFRGNGNTDIASDAYRAHVAAGFADWRLNVRGLVERPLSLTMEQIRALPQRTQITRHDCVEGWSAIGQWTGPQLAGILQMAGLQDGANYIVFRCADDFSGVPYYESCDMDDAHHPQTDHRPPAQRRAAAGQERRPAAPQDRAPARLQARQVPDRDRGSIDAGRDCRG